MFEIFQVSNFQSKPIFDVTDFWIERLGDMQICEYRIANQILKIFI